PGSSALIFRFQGSKIPALRHFGSLFYRSNSSFLLGPGSLATSAL
ncbi:22231_t:CDS:2, partial [Rhizophagus irregularis]